MTVGTEHRSALVLLLNQMVIFVVVMLIVAKYGCTVQVLTRCLQ